VVVILKAHGGKAAGVARKIGTDGRRGPETAGVPGGLQTSAKSRSPLDSVGFRAASLRLSTESPWTFAGGTSQARTRECVT